MQVVFISALEKEFDIMLADVFIQHGYRVYAIGSSQIEGINLLSSDLTEAFCTLGNDTDLIDIFIDVSDERSPNDNINVRGYLNDAVIHDLYEANVVRSLALLDTFLPLLNAGNGKRLCYITSADASINETTAVDGFGYRMSKAALHNFLQITRNVLAPHGFTMRAFDPLTGSGRPEGQGISAKLAAEAAFNYFTRRRGMERGDKLRDDEGNLVLRDAYGRQHSW